MSVLYHASPFSGIRELEPRVSNHGISQVYFSSKRENVLVYLSNAIEKFCKESGFVHHSEWTKWGPYGFDAEGKLYIDEYYPNALEETYLGVKGYIYSVERTPCIKPMPDIPFAYTSSSPVPTVSCEIVEDAYRAILDAENLGHIHVNRYNEHSEKKRLWIQKTIREEYLYNDTNLDYKYFLESKFGEIL